jgi:hypothetical protein
LGEGKGEQKWPMYFVCFYENRTMKPVEIVRMRESMDEGE